MVLDVSKAFKTFSSEADLLDAMGVEEVAFEGFNLEHGSSSNALFELLFSDQFFLQPLL